MSHLDPDLRSRARGCLLGLACGDALGGPVEFVDRAEIARGRGQLRDFVGGGWLALRPGETTDDTATALELSRSISALGRVDCADIAGRWAAWMRTRPKDIGNTAREALELIGEGTPWDEAGELVDQKAEPYGGALDNGALVRCVPVALFLHDDPPALICACRDAARVTHANPLCQWSAAGLSLLVRNLLHGEPATHGLAELVRDEEVLEVIREAADRDADALNVGGYVLGTLESAIWAFERGRDLEGAVALAASLGGEAATRAAVAGALAGARFGEEAIPERWLEQLEGREEIGALADRLIGAKHD